MPLLRSLDLLLVGPVREVTLDVDPTARSSVHVDREVVFREWYRILVTR